MENQAENENLETVEKTGNENQMKGLSIFLMVLAVGFVMWGVFTLYGDLSYKDKLVGGDAYNLIIYQIRGASWICVGVATSILALICAVFNNMAEKP